MFDKALLAELEELGVRAIQDYAPVETVPTGSLKFDNALGCGGLPRGTYTMISGMEGTGKTTLAELAAIKNRQIGNRVVYMDIERRLNIEYMYRSGLGIPGKDYGLLYPPYAEAALESIRKAVRNDIDLVILDSLAALSPRAEVEGTMDDNTVGLLARVLGKFFRAATDEVSQSGTAILMINQLREKVATGGPKMPGPPPTTRPGGKAKDFFTSIGVDMQTPEFTVRKVSEKTGEVKEDSAYKRAPAPIGMIIHGRLWKNVYGPNFVEFKVPVRYQPSLHVNVGGELAEFGRKLGVFTKKDGTTIGATTATYWYNGDEVATGEQTVATLLNSNHELAEAVENDVRQAMRSRGNVFGQNRSDDT